ncbi:MAG: hypothetical protein LBJ03_00810 [Holosporales bacterium]|jgi:hypothetical protein|nr:hypothetical protein [Holosporales bacterium]
MNIITQKASIMLILLSNLYIAHFTSHAVRSTANVAPIYFTVSGGPILPKQREFIYGETAALWPPLSANPHNVEAVSALSRQEQDCLSRDGLSFISARIKAKTGNVAVFPISKSLYQLFVVEELNYELLAGVSGSNIRSLFQESGRRIQCRSFALEGKPTSNGEEAIFAEYRKYVSESQVIDAFWAVNDFIVDFVKEQEVDMLNPTAYQIFKITNILLERIKTSADSLLKTEIPTGLGKIDGLTALYGPTLVNLFFQPLVEERGDSIHRLIMHCVLREYGSKGDTPITTIYRGGGFPKYVLHNAHSFSDGLLGGIIRDGETGCAFTYALQTSVLYYVDVELNQLADPKCPVFIPTLHSFGAAYGYRELHHPRLKLLCADMDCRIDDVSGFEKLSDVPWLGTKNKEGTIAVLRAMKRILCEQEPSEISPQAEIESTIATLN